MRTSILLLLTLVLASIVTVDTASAEESSAKAEIETLLDPGLRFAQQMLAKHGEFFPFGFALDSERKAIPVSGRSESEQPKSDDLIADIERGLRAGAESGRFRAIAIFADVRVTPPGGHKTDAVRAGLEHASGYCVDVYLPYSRSPTGDYSYGNIFAGKRVGAVFDRC